MVLKKLKCMCGRVNRLKIEHIISYFNLVRPYASFCFISSEVSTLSLTTSYTIASPHPLTSSVRPSPLTPALDFSFGLYTHWYTVMWMTTEILATRRPVTIALTTPVVSAIVVHCESSVPPTLSNLGVVVVSDVGLSNSETTSAVG